MDYVAQKNTIKPAERASTCSATKLVLIAPIDSSSTRYTHGRAIRHRQARPPDGGSAADGRQGGAGGELYAKAAPKSLDGWAAAEQKNLSRRRRMCGQRSLSSHAAKRRLGIAYETDAKVEPKVKMVGVFPDGSHPPVVYPVAATSTTTNAATLRYLDSPRTSRGQRRSSRNTGFSFLIKPVSSTAGCSTSLLQEWRCRFSWLLRVALIATAGGRCPFGVADCLSAGAQGLLGQLAADALVHLPLVLPPVVTGYLLLITLGRRAPVGAWLADNLGIVFSFRWTGAALACGVMAFPLVVRPIRAVDRSYRPAAGGCLANTRRNRVLGISDNHAAAGAARHHCRSLLLGFAKALGEFGATITFVSNIPGETQTISSAIYTRTQVPDGDRAALQLVLVSIVISVACSGGVRMARPPR